ncbi:MAG TPA: hypothetical protein VFO24_00900 [Usitatibacter sp.]|nr:hypothetical protein [Usitatibacter sp.]
MVALEQVLPFLLDAEERRHEPVEVRRHRDKELGLGLVGEGSGIGTRGNPALVEGRIGLGEPFGERMIHAREALGIVEILEGESEGEAEGGNR